MSVQIDDFYLGDEGRVEAFVYHDGRDAFMAVQPNLSESSRRAREIELDDYDIYPPYEGQKFLTWATCVEEIDERSVLAHKRRVEAMEPDWIENVRDKWETYRDLESTIFWSELEPEPVKAIVELLFARGEILPDGDWIE